MKLIWIVFLVSVVLFSCKKDDVASPSFSEARYTVTITGKWSTPAFTTPGNAHFTTFTGLLHNNNAYLWREGTKASPGTEAVAETGVTNMILAEIDSMIGKKNGLSLFSLIPPPVTGTHTLHIYCNSNYSLLSFVSMLAPTPDWFVGISGLNLYNNNKWTTDTLINLYAYDAGTEDGDVLAYNNPASVPQQNVYLLPASQATALANGNPALAPIAIARITKE